jgi:hypothetical protein
MLSLDQSQGDPRRFSPMPLSHFLGRLTSPDGERYFYDAEAEALRHSLGSQDTMEVYEPTPVVLIIDQFEEIVTAHPEYWPQRADFFRQLDEAMAADPLLWVVLSLREDYVATLEPYSSLLADKLRARFYMQRMGSLTNLLIGRPMDGILFLSAIEVMASSGSTRWTAMAAISSLFQTRPTT